MLVLTLVLVKRLRGASPSSAVQSIRDPFLPLSDFRSIEEQLWKPPTLTRPVRFAPLPVIPLILYSFIFLLPIAMIGFGSAARGPLALVYYFLSIFSSKHYSVRSTLESFMCYCWYRVSLVQITLMCEFLKRLRETRAGSRIHPSREICTAEYLSRVLSPDLKRRMTQRRMSFRWS